MAVFKKSDYQKNATVAFKKFLTEELKNVYGVGSGVKVDTNSIEYLMISDSDYPTDWETMTFRMTDGKTYKAFFEHKGSAIFEQVIG